MKQINHPGVTGPCEVLVTPWTLSASGACPKIHQLWVQSLPVLLGAQQHQSKAATRTQFETNNFIKLHLLNFLKIEVCVEHRLFS